MKKVGLFFLIFSLVLVIFLRLRFGGGKEYADISTNPIYNENQLELVYAHSDPIGNVAVSKDTTHPTRVFFTIHPESKPKGNKLLEYVNEEVGAVPYPGEKEQDLFTSVLGIFTDNQNRLWTLDYGNHGFKKVKLLAFNLTTNQIVHEYTFPKKVAPIFSQLNDLSVSPNGEYVVISNPSFIGKKPSIVCYNIKTGESRSLLKKHSSVNHSGFVPVTPAKKMRFFGGMMDLLTAIDGIDFSRDGRYVYYAGMSNAHLFRISTEILFDFSKTNEELFAAVEIIAPKPLSDGIRTDNSGNIYITDIEHSGVYFITPDGKGTTLIKDEKIRWADGMSLSGNGTFYLADSNIPDQLFQSKKHMKENAPYSIYKFKALQNFIVSD